MDKEPNRHHIYERTAIFVFGVVFVIGLLVLAIIFSEPTDFQYMVFRIVLALATAGIAVFIPGFIEAYAKNWVRAGGAIAVFVVVYFFSPASFVTQPKTKPNLANSNEPSSAIVNPQAGDRATQVNIAGRQNQITINQGFSEEQLRQVLEEHRSAIQEQYAKGVSEEATVEFFKRLGENNVDPSEYETRLLKFADDYLRLKLRLAQLEETHGEVRHLRNEAYKALDNAKLDRARVLLLEAIQIKETKRNHENKSVEKTHNNLTEQEGMNVSTSVSSNSHSGDTDSSSNIELPPGSTGGGFDPDVWMDNGKKIVEEHCDYPSDDALEWLTRTDPRDEIILVTEPIPHSKVKQKTCIKGVTRNYDDKIFVCIRPVYSNTWWFQPKVRVNEEGKWCGLMYVGPFREKTIVVTEYEICVIVNPKYDLTTKETIQYDELFKYYTSLGNSYRFFISRK